MPVFVQLTLFVSGETILVNIGKAVAITPMTEKEKGSTIRFVDGWKLAVKETNNRIFELTQESVQRILNA